MSGRTLLLSPPSLSSQPERLNGILQSYDRKTTDLQMLDRLILGVVNLPDAAYSRIIILAGEEDSISESSKLTTRETFSHIARSLQKGGYICSQHEQQGQAFDHNEAVLVGLIPTDNGKFVKPDIEDMRAVPLRLGRKKHDKTISSNLAEPVRNHQASPTVAQDQAEDGFRYSSGRNIVTASAHETSDNEIIDEEDLLDGSELAAPIIQPPECRPKAGRRRRACKDCTCGLAQKLEEEDAMRRHAADKQLGAMKLSHGDLAEVDFTVQGKVGSCGNCSLGDAFRCEGCPFIGLPAFQPGEEIRLLNDDIQL
uniref:Fe-S cluster assembly protein dre2 n=1 Tax=Aspergillus clavatus (strain ATCC 1007 / CBS 513.65 / DSM 816 / NCTC 3887 / NRRL 1 / QM 1276 / 107) TaxID=344612 RepID=DRE2_ASPCL|nr:RecName: Full=Fe-S cluster assembly protein dre2; AltName: Full=Anamorsin homolog [Aspergillus clavatus NRRL 1]